MRVLSLNSNSTAYWTWILLKSPFPHLSRRENLLHRLSPGGTKWCKPSPWHIGSDQQMSLPCSFSLLIFFPIPPAQSQPHAFREKEEYIKAVGYRGAIQGQFHVLSSPEKLYNEHPSKWQQTSHLLKTAQGMRLKVLCKFFLKKFFSSLPLAEKSF